MRAKAIPDVARDFLDAYRDPEIDKRMFFEMWADRAGCTPVVRRQVWDEVRRISYRLGARKRQILHQRKAAPAGA